MTQKKTIDAPAVASVPLPSADLIIYRFDQTDRKFEEINVKLDRLTNGFITKEEAQMLKDERDAKFAEIERRFANQAWYWRALVIAVLTALATSGAALIFKN